MPVEYSPPTYPLGANALGLDAGHAEEEAPQIVVTWLEAPRSSRHRSKSRSKSRRPAKSKSPHRTPLSIVQALVEERRKASEITALEARLAAEMQRADEAVSRAQYAESRREKEALAAAAQFSTRRAKMEQEIVAIESSSRDYQVQLELTARELRRARTDGELLQAEFDQLARSYKDMQEQCRKYQTALKASQARMDGRETAIQTSMKKWFVNGEGVGYDNGYQDGYEEGRKDGKRQGIKAGRKDGLREGIEQGRAEERRNAMDAIDEFLAEDGYKGGDSTGIRRWAQSVYYPQSQRAYSDIGSNPAAP